MSEMYPLYPPQTSSYPYSGAELDAAPSRWYPALEYSRQPPMANQNYIWIANSDEKCSLDAAYQQSMTFPQFRSPGFSLPQPPSADIVQTTPHHINAIESPSVSRSLEMVHPLASHPLDCQQLVSWPAQNEYEYEYVSYPGTQGEAAVAPAYYYRLPSTGNYNGRAGPTYSSYTYMQLYPPPSYAWPNHIVLNGCPIKSPLVADQNLYAPYTPISSNPSLGTAASQFDEHGHIDSTDGSEALFTHIMPAPLHAQTTLPLGPGMTSEPVTMYPSHQQESFTPFQQQSAHHEANIQVPASYVPLSPVSPVLEDPLATSQVVTDATTPATAATHSTTFIAESGHQEEEDTMVSTEPVVDMLLDPHTAERRKKSRERRHKVACIYCRTHKIACHASVQLGSTEPGEGIPPGISWSSSFSPHAHNSKCKPKTMSPVAGVPHRTCRNCLHRGWECVYLPPAPRPRRRGKVTKAAPVVTHHQRHSPCLPDPRVNPLFSPLGLPLTNHRLGTKPKAPAKNPSNE